MSLVIWSLVVWSPAHADSSNTALHEARKLYQQGDYEEAYRLCNEVLANPQTEMTGSEAQLLCAKCLRRLGNAEAAVLELKKVIAKGASQDVTAAARLELAETFAKDLKDCASALPLYEVLFGSGEVGPLSAPAKLGAALCEVKYGDVNRGMKALEMITEDHSGSDTALKALLTLANEYARRYETRAAQMHLREILEDYPEEAFWVSYSRRELARLDDLVLSPLHDPLLILSTRVVLDWAWVRRSNLEAPIAMAATLFLARAVPLVVVVMAGLALSYSRRRRSKQSKGPRVMVLGASVLAAYWAIEIFLLHIMMRYQDDASLIRQWPAAAPSIGAYALLGAMILAFLAWPRRPTMRPSWRTLRVATFVAAVGGGILVSANGISRALHPTVLSSLAAEGPAVAQGTVRVSVGVLALLIVGSLGEECLYRGILFTSLRRCYDAWFAIIGSAIVFGFAHVGSVIAIIGYSLFGVLTAAVVNRTGSIFPTAAAHFALNVIAVLYTS